MEEDVESAISKLRTDLQQQTISFTTLQHLQALLDDARGNDANALFTAIPPPLLLPPLTAAMDSGPTGLSLASSDAYLSLLLSPNSPVLALFSPIPFLSLLRSLRRALKPRAPPPNSSASGDENKELRRGPTKKKKKRNDGDSELELEESGFDVRVVVCVVEKLVDALDLVHLGRFPDCFKSLVHTVVEVLVLSYEVVGGNARSYNRLVELCKRVLGRVLEGSESGGEREAAAAADTAAEVLKALAGLILGAKSPARRFALEFVKGLTLGGSGVKRAVVNLPRYLAQKAPEKVEGRLMVVEAVMEIVKALDMEDQIGFVEHVLKMTRAKSNLRLVGVDLIMSLMTSLDDPFRVDSGCNVADSWGFKCLQALIDRCSDSSAGIRARALSNLAQLVGFLSSDDGNREVLSEVMGFGKVATKGEEGGMNDVLRKRCMDEKANVRRAALVLVTKLTALLGGNFDGVVLKTIGMACSDPLVSIRKAAILALSEAFRTYSDESVTIEWLHSVPRLITDNESSIQEECENLFLELVLDRISRAGSASTSAFHDSNVKTKNIEKEIELLFPGGVLILLKEICNGEVTPWVKKICTNLGKKKKLKIKIATALQDIIRKSEGHWLSHSMPIEKWTAPPGAWFLLSEVSAYLSKAVDWEFLHHHWQLLDKYGNAGEIKSPTPNDYMYEGEENLESNPITWAGDRVFLLQTISNVSVELPPEPAADLAHNLLKRIEEFNMHSTEVSAHVRALRTLCKRKALDANEADLLVKKWVEQVLSKACRVVERYISRDSEATDQNYFFTPPSGSRKGKRAAAASRRVSEAVTAVYTIGSLVIVCPSVDMNPVVPLLHPIITSSNSGPKLGKLPVHVVSLKQTASSLYIQAWLTMGKICLADGKLAKSYIPLFVQELEKSDCAALRNNLVVMMADFCVRYTALVDGYISKITKCLRDSCELVRRQTFILLSRLLQRDYVKWRGVLFLRFLLSLVDESEQIRQLADFLFGNILKVKAPLLAYNSFVEAIFVLNDCTSHGGHSASKSSETENRLFSIRGNDETSRSKRMHIYVSLLKQMAPEHLLATFAKLCAEILAAASDGMLSIDDVTGQSVLQDAFQVLACKELRIPSGRGSQTEAADIDEEGGDGGASAVAAKGRAITQAVRRGLIQNTIPIFIELKRLLESKNSPLTGSLMECLRILLKDYKNEIDEILVADKQLQKELIYDMQKYETAKAKSTVAEAVASIPNQSSFLSPKATSGTHAHNKFTEKLKSDARVASAMADAAAEATARSVLREVNKGASTPSLGSISVPKLKSGQGRTAGRNDLPLNVLESLRKRQPFISDDEN